MLKMGNLPTLLTRFVEISRGFSSPLLFIVFASFITLANKILLLDIFMTNFYFLINYEYLTTECGKIFTPSTLSCAYYYVKNIYYEGSLNRVKFKTESQSQVFT